MGELPTSCHPQSTEYYQTLLQIWHHDFDHSSLTLTLHDRGKIYIGAWVSSQHPVILSLRNIIKLCFKYDHYDVDHSPLTLTHDRGKIYIGAWVSSRHPLILSLRNIIKLCFKYDIMTLTIPLLLSHYMTKVKFTLEHGWAQDNLSSSVYRISSNPASNMTSWRWPFLSYSQTIWQR